MRVVGTAGKIRSLINQAGLVNKFSYRDVQTNGKVYKVKCPLWNRSVKADPVKVNAAIDSIKDEYGDLLISAELKQMTGYHYSGRYAYEAIVVHLKR